MCGISGALWWSERGFVSESTFDSMTDMMSHRGPDGRGVHRRQYSNGVGVALGHRRLSIIDVEGGGQPQHNETKDVWIVFNGEIYNYVELYDELIKKGHRFQTRSDTEVIVHLYEEYGEECLEYLRGMFAFAIWDENKQRLFFARDRLGQKPFVYHQTSEGFYFGSEIKVLLGLPFFNKKLREESITEYLLYGYIPHPHSAFQGISKLPPAHYGVIEQGRLRIHKYWNPELTPNPKLSLAESQELIRHRVQDSVRTQLRSDVPLGCFLSGGIDSTVISGAIQEQLDAPLNTFTIGFGVEGYDESSFAATAAKHLGTNHRCLQVEPDSMDILDRLVWLFDEPFSDSSAIPTYFLSRETRKYVKVALTGDGGDEAFAGYGRHRTAEALTRFDRLPSWLRGMLTSRWVDALPRGSGDSKIGKLKNRLTVLRRDFSKRYLDWVSPFTLEHVEGLTGSGPLRGKERDGLRFLSGIIEGLSPMSDGLRAMRADMFSYLPGDLLAKVDIVSMAHGLECRSPFLDHLLIEDAMRIPFEHLIAGQNVKPMLSETFKKWIPEELRRRPKMGFRIPLSYWLRGSEALGQNQLASKDSFCAQYLDRKAIEEIVAMNQTGKWDFGDRLWSLLFLERWGRLHF